MPNPHISTQGKSFALFLAYTCRNVNVKVVFMTAMLVTAKSEVDARVLCNVDVYLLTEIV